MAQQGILWQLVSGFNPGAAYTQGLQQYNQQQNILQQLAGQEQDRQFNRDKFGQEFQYRQTNDAANRALQERQLTQQAQNAAASQGIQRAQLELQRAQFQRGEVPAGFEQDPNNPGQLRPRVGGPMDPNYLRAKQDATPKPLSPGFQKAEDEILTDLQSLNTINGQLKRFGTMINEGKLNLGLYNNAKSQFQNYIGKSDDNSVNYADFKATLEKHRNDSLRLNKGVQTEGDAQRAWNELFANINDPKVVAGRLERIHEYNQQAATFKRNLIAQRRSDNRLPALDVDRVLGITPQANTQSGNPLDDARRAIAAGANPEAVRQRLIQNGINPQGL